MAIITDTDVRKWVENIQNWLPDGRALLITKNDVAYCEKNEDSNDRG